MRGEGRGEKGRERLMEKSGGRWCRAPEVTRVVGVSAVTQPYQSCLAGVSGGEVGAVDSERVNLDLPVRGRGQRNVVELTDVVVGVSATEGELARVAVHALGEARLEAAKVERKLALVDESVGDHAAEGRRHAVHHVRVVAHGDFVERLVGG